MKRNILIIDDSESIREAISLALSGAGYAVEKACDGKEGIDKLNASAKVDLIITDLNMPNMDGIGVVQEVRKSATYRYLPILILTTESQNEKRMEARKAGATGWIIKPFSSDKLVQVIQKVLR